MTDEILKLPSPAKIREELEELVVRELLGPAGGPDEELSEKNMRPKERYLLGMLAPKKMLVGSEEDEELAVGGTDAVEDGQTEVVAPQTESIIPSSLGLTFAVLSEAKAIKITVRWGKYVKVESETLINEETGNPQRVWKRFPMEGISQPIPLRDGIIPPWIVKAEEPDVFVRGLIRKNQKDWLVTIFLINNQTEQDRLVDEKWLFQPELVIESTDGSSAFISRGLPYDSSRPDKAYLEERMMDMLYRHHMEFAVGHGTAVHVKVDPKDSSRAYQISNRAIPRYEVPKQTPPTKEEIPALQGLVLDMKVLAQSKPEEVFDKLKALPSAYAEWIKKEREKISQPQLSEFRDQAEAAFKNCERALIRIQEGLNLLKADKQALSAFQFANESMWLQRTHTILSEKIRRGEKIQFDEVDIESNRSWYPFQLAFILINLPGLTDIKHKDRTGDMQATADLLWFPTGGGKTEAYLGLTAYTLAIRRLQGAIAGRSGDHGVAVLMRYTLRLLSLQQFQRATTLICACESIRRERMAKGDSSLGKEPFRVGLWVGYRTTPNTTDQSDEAVQRDHGRFMRGGSGTPAQIKNCPWCGQLINPGRDICVETYSKGRGRTFIYCGDALGSCLFSKRQSPDEGIPILVVDEEIYRKLPALLIATVDKFAQMPWNGATQMLFGRVTGYCSRHGFRSPEIEDADSHNQRGSLPRANTVPHEWLRPPDLIIQDELHLISGPLGTLVGLYETVVDELASWTVDGQSIRPKVIASTATIRRADEQVRNLFLRSVEIFPPQGTDIRDNFFSIQREPEEMPGRLYIGICAPGRKFKNITVRVYVALLAASQKLYEKYDKHVDPWMTLVGYFNSMRDLGGTRRLVDDRVRSILRDMDIRGLAKRKKPNVQELTSRMAAVEIPETLDLLEVGFDPKDDEKRREFQEKGQYYQLPMPVDVLLATNMLSVGVDVKRLGLMVVSNQPKTTAEYIQATSRVGRSKPGLVCTVFNWARPRDLSHYERFEHYHSTFYKHVEALSLTPFSKRALDRGLTALLVALIRLAGPRFNENKTASEVRRDHDYVKQAFNSIIKRAEKVLGTKEDINEVKAMLERRLDVWFAAAANDGTGKILGYKTVKDSVTKGLLHPPSLQPWDLFTTLTSLRDVEPTVALVLDHLTGSGFSQQENHETASQEDS